MASQNSLKEIYKKYITKAHLPNPVNSKVFYSVLWFKSTMIITTNKWPIKLAVFRLSGFNFILIVSNIKIKITFKTLQNGESTYGNKMCKELNNTFPIHCDLFDLYSVTFISQYQSVSFYFNVC